MDLLQSLCPFPSFLFSYESPTPGAAVRKVPLSHVAEELRARSSEKGTPLPCMVLGAPSLPLCAGLSRPRGICFRDQQATCQGHEKS